MSWCPRARVRIPASVPELDGRNGWDNLEGCNCSCSRHSSFVRLLAILEFFKGADSGVLGTDNENPVNWLVARNLGFKGAPKVRLATVSRDSGVSRSRNSSTVTGPPTLIRGAVERRLLQRGTFEAR